MATQQQIALQMVAQLRVLDPSISAEVGTPERKIIDTVAQALAESQVDLNILSGGLDLDSKFASDLDRFLGIFGFGRQKATKATGFVTFSRSGASTFDIPIPGGTQVIAPGGTGGTGDGTNDILFRTTAGVTLPAGSTSVIAPVECIIAGTLGNLAANKITTFGSTVLGITAVTNEAPTLNGLDFESDDEFKIRFKNTVFRNMAGTQDQYLALAVATAFTTKANVVGPISRYREYIQVPDVDDTAADPDSGISGNSATAGEYTSALSTIPYSKFIYSTIPYFISNNKLGADAIFFRQDTDYYLNSNPALKNRGDAYRGAVAGVSTSPLDTTTLFQPNVTFKNIYTGPDSTVQAIRAKDVVLFEHSYMSTASRNDWARNITNCVDVYINGVNPTLASAVIAKPSTSNIVTANTTDPYYYDNYRRVGEPNHRPVLGNIMTPLFWSPVTDLPDSITVGTVTYFEGIHYWLVKDVSQIGLTVRARDGIEWSPNINGANAGDPLLGPYTGAKIAANSATSVTVNNYSFDKNVNDLQASLVGAKQVTTDILAHTATARYFKLDLTIMYSPGRSQTDVNADISAAVAAFFDGQYFGTTIQLSDILQAVHNVPGVDNVRWSKEILAAQGLSTDASGNPRDRVVECDVNGNSLVNVVLDRKVTGDGSTAEVWTMYLTGSPTGGSFKLSYAGNTTGDIAYNASSSTISTALSSASIPISVSSGSGTAASPYILTFTSNGTRMPNALTANPAKLTGGTTLYNADFFLRDDQLPALPSAAIATDTVAGLVLRPRAQNTWNQL
jgi:uncharacterized phage protein gp47/JayE